MARRAFQPTHQREPVVDSREARCTLPASQADENVEPGRNARRGQDQVRRELEAVEGVGGDGGDIVAMTEHRLSAATIRQIEFELEKAEHGLAMPYDAERVGQLHRC